VMLLSTLESSGQDASTPSETSSPVDLAGPSQQLRSSQTESALPLRERPTSFSPQKTWYHVTNQILDAVEDGLETPGTTLWSMEWKLKPVSPTLLEVDMPQLATLLVKMVPPFQDSTQSVQITVSMM